jgi:regulator of telomere elongation helicase 1
MPYNYLIDPTIRQRIKINFENAVIVFDEVDSVVWMVRRLVLIWSRSIFLWQAHNLEGVCGDSASFDLTATDLASCIQEVHRPSARCC